MGVILLGVWWETRCLMCNEEGPCCTTWQSQTIGQHTINHEVCKFGYTGRTE